METLIRNESGTIDTVMLIDGVEFAAGWMREALDGCVAFLLEAESQDAYVGLRRTLERIQPGLGAVLDASLEAKGVEVTKMSGWGAHWVCVPNM